MWIHQGIDDLQGFGVSLSEDEDIICIIQVGNGGGSVYLRCVHPLLSHLPINEPT